MVRQSRASGGDGAAPYFYTAPAAVACAGITLLLHGELALLDSWSPITMGFTHFATLGFVSMTGMGAFYRTAPMLLDRPQPGRALALAGWLGFAIGAASLCIGLAGVSVTPVFVAIGALFPALLAFFWPATRLLRGTTEPAPGGAWRLAVYAFLTVAALGIWVAHGHGGMKFPGPRALWIQLHLSIALFGWVGGMAVAGLGVRVRDVGGTPNPLPRLWSQLATLGIVLCVVVLAVDYAGGLEVEPATARAVGLLAASPVIVATALWSTRWAFAELAGPNDHPLARDEALLWRAAFAFGPITLAAAALAILQDDAASRVLFGWIAIWGWAGLVAHALLRSLAPPRLGAQVTLGLHLATLAVGLLATATRNGELALFAGAALIAFALTLIPRPQRA